MIEMLCVLFCLCTMDNWSNVGTSLFYEEERKATNVSSQAAEPTVIISAPMKCVYYPQKSQIFQKIINIMNRYHKIFTIVTH